MIVPIVVALVVVGFVGVFLGQRAAYRNGFWDGVLWERARGDRTWPIDADHDLYTPGAESRYPSKPDPTWHGWDSLSAGAHARKDEVSS